MFLLSSGLILQTRSSFLLTGLAAAKTSATGECSVCLEALTASTATSLPCEHVFCHDCISDWLGRSSNNTCPNCRKVLFAAVSTASANATGPADTKTVAREVRTGIIQAYKDSGLGQSIRRPNDRAILYGMVFKARELQSVLPTMFDFLAGSLIAAPGPTVVRARLLRAPLATMAHMLQAFVTSPVGPKLTAEQYRQWSVIVSKLQSVLRSVERKDVDGLVLPKMLFSRLQSALIVDAKDFPDIERDAPFAQMVSILLNFLTEQAKVRTVQVKLRRKVSRCLAAWTHR